MIWANVFFSKWIYNTQVHRRWVVETEKVIHYKRMFLLTALFNKRRLLYKKNTEKTKSDMLILIIIELKLYNITDVVSLSYKYKPCKSINKSLYITFRCCCCKADPSFLQLSRSVRVETRELRSQLLKLWAGIYEWNVYNYSAIC